MNENLKMIAEENEELFALAGRLQVLAREFLRSFNEKKFSLKHLTPAQRIFLFFVTRSLKSYSAIYLLCQGGYGQDVATILRSLLENLISAKYIVRDPRFADQMASRFVEYKWVIFKRHLAEEELNLVNDSAEARNDFLEKKNTVLAKVAEFKRKYNIVSDKALLTWSGRSIRDMAKLIDHKLLEEYDSTFRLCSRFSHPSIIGDKSYLIHGDGELIFSVNPSMDGIILNLKSAIRYLNEFLKMFIELYQIDKEPVLEAFQDDLRTVFGLGKYDHPTFSEKAWSMKDKDTEMKVCFKFD